MAGGSALLKRPLVLGSLALLVALAIAVTLAVTKPWASTKDRTDVAAPASGDRVLQSVDVTMQDDGALTRVGDTVVIARAQGGRADTYSTTYDPTKVVDQLPVRVLTSYQTDQGSGTDLGDLKGYSGRVTLNLTVQNLTVRSQDITYDVAGKAQTTTALVGAPLTVVASAALPGIDPATIVTAAADAPADSSSDSGTTNGVISRSPEGTTQVQWASILAPPQLDPTATFRVVLDAKDFVVPTVDLSVQPGLVTDPSVGALIDSAFNPKNSDELALETRTIALIGDVNDVLGRASGTISGVRKTLDASSKTLGTKTVQSLTEDTKTISTSLKSSSDNIDSLGDDLRSSLQTTQSATLQRMSETVSGLQDLIGDTSASEPDVPDRRRGLPDDGQGVGRRRWRGVREPARGHRPARRLQGGDRRLQAGHPGRDHLDHRPGRPGRDELPGGRRDPGRHLLARPGPGALRRGHRLHRREPGRVEPTSTRPRSAPSRARSPPWASSSGRSATRRARCSSDDPKDGAPALVRVDASLTDASKALTSADGTLGDLTDALDDVRGEAVANQKKVASMRAQSDDLAAALCDVAGDGTQPGRLSAAQVEELRAYLVDQGCDKKTDLTPPDKWDTPLADRLDGQVEALGAPSPTRWTPRAATTTSGAGSPSLRQQLGDLGDAARRGVHERQGQPGRPGQDQHRGRPRRRRP